MTQSLNKGGRRDLLGVARHADAREPLVVRTTARTPGESCGFVIETPGRADALLRRRHERVRRHGADRADLRARRRRAPDRRPLHDGPARGGRRARAARRREALLPSHYGTFPLLTGTPDALRGLACPLASSCCRPHPGRRSSCDAGRERWFGRPGRRVPEIALDGTVDVEGALVLDAVDDVEACARRTRRGFRSSSARRPPRR